MQDQPPSTAPDETRGDTGRPDRPHSHRRGGRGLILWNGQLTTRRRLLSRGALYIGLPSLWISLLLLLPCLVLMVVAFTRRDSLSVDWSNWTLDSFRRLAGYETLGWTANYLLILWRSVWVAAMTTAICLLLAYPLAFFIASRSPRVRYMLLGLVMVPFCTNMVIRIFGWQVIFATQFPLAKMLSAWGLWPEDRPLYPSALAVYVGMVTTYLPFAILPIYTNVERLDWSIVEAAHDLYAGRWRAFRHAIVPQTVSGLLVAIILTFVPAMGTYIVTDRLGGGKYDMIGNLIGRQFGDSRDLPFGAAISLALMLLTLIALVILRTRARLRETEVAG